MSVNPFRFGQVATGSYFTNRTRELAELRADIAVGQNVVIISPRRYGKTSLIAEARTALVHDGVLVAYIDLFATPSIERLADVLAATIHTQLVSPVERAAQRTMDVFRSLPIQPRVTLGPDGTPSFEFSFGAQARDSTQTIEHLLALPGRIARERKRRVALIFDEFQEVLAIDPHLPALMRAIFQVQEEVAHVFLGSKRHLMHNVFMQHNQPLYKMAKPLVLQPIAAQDFAAFIAGRCRETGLEIDDAAIAKILVLTGGHPHDTQELCHFLWARAQGARLVVIESPYVEAALDDVLDAESAYYTMLWDDVSPHQRLVLLALVAEAGRLYSEGYRRRHRLGAVTTTQRSVARLLEREVIEGDGRTGYRVSETFFRVWIARRMRSDTVP